MPTNKIVLKNADEFQSAFNPVYVPLISRFLARSKSYVAEVGKHDFRHIETVGDIRGHHYQPKDTEIKQIAVAEGKKSFKKFFKATQYVQSTLQDPEGNEEVTARVLDEHNVQYDENFMSGDTTDGASSGILNNGLIYSADSNYVLKSSTEIVSGTGRLADLHQKMVATVEESRAIAGRKVLYVYGEALTTLLNGIYTEGTVPFRRVLEEVLVDVEVVVIPKAAVPANAGLGWILVNHDQIMFHYTQLPALLAQGQNEEKMYTWHNFLQGTTMLEVQVKNAVIRQPATLAS